MNILRIQMHGRWRTAALCAVGTVGVVLFTLPLFRLHLGFGVASFCYLLLLVLQSLAGDFISSAVVSLLAVGCLDYFFTEPILSFDVMSPFDTLGLVSFLITSLVITRLVATVRAKTRSSQLHQEMLQGLYGLAQQLLALEPDPHGGHQFLQPFCGVFGITAACLFDAVSAEVYFAGNGTDDLERKTGEAFIRGKPGPDRNKVFSARCIQVGGRTIGSIGFEGLEDPGMTAGPLAALAAAHLERTHSFVHASRAVATAQTESYRTAILDALAHEFKTPLSTIMTAAGSLREARSLGAHHREMAETVESEAARLARLTSRLIRTARLEREEVRPWMELIDVSAVIASTVDQYARLSSDRRINVVKDSESNEVMADPELLRLAVSQLLDNACKYSTAGSTVTVKISRELDRIAIRVLSDGNSIPLTERNKIFDRFYRGLDGRRVGPGSGLGLFVARKIVVALGGNLDLDADPGTLDGTSFRLALPVPENEREHVATAV
jgi:two-component system sensor histidine kinase KdpD